VRTSSASSAPSSTASNRLPSDASSAPRSQSDASAPLSPASAPSLSSILSSQRRAREVAAVKRAGDFATAGWSTPHLCE
jgi:hypothetical protein